MCLKVGIICAGDREIAPFINHIENVSISEKAMLKLYEGSIHGVNVVALFSGVCKVNAAIATQILIDYFGVNAIINAGTAGGMDVKLQIYDTVISTEIAYHVVAEKILTKFHPWMDSIYFKADTNLLTAARTAVSKLDYTVYWGRMVVVNPHCLSWQMIY